MSNLIELVGEIRDFINCYTPIEYRLKIEDGSILISPIDVYDHVPELSQALKEWLGFIDEPVGIEDNGDQIIIYPLEKGEDL